MWEEEYRRKNTEEEKEKWRMTDLRKCEMMGRRENNEAKQTREE